MNKIRRGPQVADNFTMLPNSQIRDGLLTWEARGLLAWLHSHQEGFEVTEAAMIEAGSFGRDGVRRMVRELEKAGYLYRDRTYDVSGGSAVDYVLMDPRATPQPSPGTDAPAVARPEQAQQSPVEGVSAGKAADAPADAQAVPRSSLENQEKTKEKTSSSPRGTRLPEDFIPTPEMRKWFAQEKLHLVLDARIEHEKFVNYWVGCPGQKGRKLDWPRTWMNWMWTQAERAPRRPGNSLAPTSGAPFRPSTTDQKVAQTLELGRRMQQMEEQR